MGRHVTHWWASENELCLAVVKTPCRVEAETHYIVSFKYFLGEGLLDVSRVILSHDVLLFSWIEAASGDYFSVEPSSNQTKAASPSFSEMESRTPPSRSSKAREKCTMRNLSDVASSFRENVPHIALESAAK